MTPGKVFKRFRRDEHARHAASSRILSHRSASFSTVASDGRRTNASAPAEFNTEVVRDQRSLLQSRLANRLLRNDSPIDPGDDSSDAEKPYGGPSQRCVDTPAHPSTSSVIKANPLPCAQTKHSRIEQGASSPVDSRGSVAFRATVRGLRVSAPSWPPLHRWVYTAAAILVAISLMHVVPHSHTHVRAHTPHTQIETCTRARTD